MQKMHTETGVELFQTSTPLYTLGFEYPNPGVGRSEPEWAGVRRRGDPGMGRRD
jgi:hypothetical protein